MEWINFDLGLVYRALLGVSEDFQARDCREVVSESHVVSVFTLPCLHGASQHQGGVTL